MAGLADVRVTFAAGGHAWTGGLSATPSIQFLPAVAAFKPVAASLAVAAAEFLAEIGRRNAGTGVGSACAFTPTRPVQTPQLHEWDCKWEMRLGLVPSKHTQAPSLRQHT